MTKNSPVKRGGKLSGKRGVSFQVLGGKLSGMKIFSPVVVLVSEDDFS